MENLELDAKHHFIIWKIDAMQAQKNELGWKMLENNQIEGIFSFEYYYLDNLICFRYPYHSLQRIVDYFQRKKGNFETIFLLCEGVLSVIERGQEYLLNHSGYLINPEWIFWNHFEKKIWLCYLPGKQGDLEKEFTTFVEYLMEHTDHSDRRAVELIYGLYDVITSESFIIENILSYLREHSYRIQNDIKEYQTIDINKDNTAIEKKVKQREEDDGTKAESTKNLQEKRKKKDVETGIYMNMQLIPCSLNKLSAKKDGKIYHALLYSKKDRECIIDREEMVVGRLEGSDMYLPFSVISRRHALIFYENLNIYIMDTASKNGTYVNGNKISAYVKTECKEGDVITFADISFRLDRKNTC